RRGHGAHAVALGPRLGVGLRQPKGAPPAAVEADGGRGRRGLVAALRLEGEGTVSELLLWVGGSLRRDEQRIVGHGRLAAAGPPGERRRRRRTGTGERERRVGRALPDGVDDRLGHPAAAGGRRGPERPAEGLGRPGADADETSGGQADQGQAGEAGAGAHGSYPGRQLICGSVVNLPDFPVITGYPQATFFLVLPGAKRSGYVRPSRLSPFNA